jgi:hypothetical protein
MLTLTDEEVFRLRAMLEERNGIVCTVDEYCTMLGLSFEATETFLSHCYLKHDIGAVLSGDEVLGPAPILFIEGKDAGTRTILCSCKRGFYNQVLRVN